MSDQPKLRDLVADAITDHGKATADLLRRVGQEEKIDPLGETMQCLGDLVQTGARFFLFWDNIATLAAMDGAGQGTPYPHPLNCAPGEIQDFALDIPGVKTPKVPTGLRRRGETKTEIAAKAISATATNNTVDLRVDCSGAPRGLYEGTLTMIGADGQPASQVFNVYIDPKPRP